MADASPVVGYGSAITDPVVRLGRAALNNLIGTDVPLLRKAVQNRLLPVTVCPAIGQGTTAGKLRTNAAITYSVAGLAYKKASTDDAWACGALGTTAAGEYKALPLYINGAGTISLGTLTAAAASDVLAQALIDAVPAAMCRVGFFVMGPSGNFANALNAQGTSYDGSPVVADLTAYQVSW